MSPMDVLAVLITLAVAAIALWAAWWLFRMVFWLVILFIGEAGRAWRGD